MRKQELIHLHGLLATVREFCEEDLGETVDRAQYSELPIQPTSIHKSKADHQEAVAALATDIVDGLEADGDALETRETETATAD